MTQDERETVLSIRNDLNEMGKRFMVLLQPEKAILESTLFIALQKIKYLLGEQQ